MSLDEDLGSGVRNQIAPWMRVTVSVPSPGNVTIQAIYFQTSEQEDIVGGKQRKTPAYENAVIYGAGDLAFMPRHRILWMTRYTTPPTTLTLMR